MAFPPGFIEDLNERCDIVEVVSDYVELKQKGVNLFGRCPFHSEKTPSFSVNRDKQIYHCFGCGVGGDVISFVMRAENLEFPDAVRFLASRAGIVVPEESDNAASKQRARLLEINKEAARFFYNNLQSSAGDKARRYLEKRGISEKTAKRFGLGYALDSWDSLITGISGYEKSELIAAGLAIAGKNGRVHDKFRDRLMFPIINIRGDVVAFGGRVFDDSTPKYLNSPETPVFNKSQNLFALNIAKMVKGKRLILAEGYMDVIALHQAGFDGAVASLGTSLTEAQARLISKYAEEVVIAYDMDQAGRSATERAISILQKTGLPVKVLELGDSKDPDEFIRKYGSEAFAKKLERSENHIEYRLDAIKAKYDLEDDADRVRYLRDAANLISTLNNPVERAVYAGKIAELGRVSVSVVEKEASLAYSRRTGKEKKKDLRKILSPVTEVQPRSKELRYDNIRSAMAEEGVIRLTMRHSNLLTYASERLSGDIFSAPVLSKIFVEMIKLSEAGMPVTPALLSQSLSGDEMDQLSRILFKESAEDNPETEIKDYIKIIEAEHQKRTPDEGNGLIKQWEMMREKKMWQ